MAETETSKKEASKPNQWKRMVTPERLKAYGALTSVRPGGDFDPGGEWTQAWEVWLLKRGDYDINHRGFIRLERRSPAGNGFELEVTQNHVQRAQRAVHEMTARAQCLADATATPVTWEVRTNLADAHDNVDIPLAGMAKTGAVEDGQLRWKSGGYEWHRSLPVGPLAFNWGLLEALPRLHEAGRTEALDFTLLDELDKVKPGHVLRRRETIRIPFGDESVEAVRYDQVGRGFLPWDYYVDAHTHRVLLAVNGLRIYALNSRAEFEHEKVREQLRRSPKR